MSDEPPYLRIAADLRHRIEAGELQPGDRLPSARALAARRGVALATAARALTELRRAGLVRTQPRVGSVVSPAARPRTGPPPAGPDPSRARRVPAEAGLTRARVVRAAVGIADAQGVDAVSMRAVAASLGVAPMSLYRHVAGKEQLVLLMAEAAYGEADYPRVPPPGWRARLELGARTLWRLYHRHPWLAGLQPLARPLPLPHVLRHGEWILAALADVGLPAARALDLQIILYSHGQGLAVNREREMRARADTGVSDEQWGDRQGPAFAALARSGRYPHFADLLADLAVGYDFQLDALFETSLHALLDGFAVLIAREGADGLTGRTRTRCPG